ncbi:MAG: tRNA (N6-threonylcarbamoyladenosine(37)-N6)-methyltransferase TrmO [Bdellovibrionales bacterium]
MCEVKSIGKICSPFKTKFAVPRQSQLVEGIHSKVCLKKSVQPEIALNGIERFSHIWLIWHFHLNTNKKYRAKVSPPRSPEEKLGVFATRSPHRPSPIGMSVVELVEVGKDHVWVKGADLVQDTPILDIKPYIASYDSFPEAKTGWLHAVDARLDSVLFSEEFNSAISLEFDQITSGRDFNNSSQFLDFVESLLLEDPRPKSFKAKPSLEKVFVMELYNIEIFFEIQNNTAIVSHYKFIRKKKSGNYLDSLSEIQAQLR